MSVCFKDVLVYDPVEPTGVRGPLDVVVEGQRIARVGKSAATPSSSTSPNDSAEGAKASDAPIRTIQGDGHHLLVPGLINAHFHSSVNHLKGSLPSVPLEMFMLYESPAAASRPTAREAYLRTMLGALEMLRTGTTAVQDDLFLLPEADPEIIDAVLQAYADSGLRASVALDQPQLAETDKLPFLAELAPSELRRALATPPTQQHDELLALYEHLFTRWHGTAGGRLTAAVSISAPQRVTPEYFAALDRISEREHVPLYAHMLETRTQRVLQTAQPRFGGSSLVAYTAALGLLTDRTNVIHAIWVDGQDLDLIADAGAVIAHNPVSNLRLGSGVMPFRAVRDRGIAVALGSDEALAGDTCDMWRTVAAAALVHNVTGLDSDLWPTPAEVLDALWCGGAAAMLRRDELGAVRPGALADLVLLDLFSPPFVPLNDVRGQLVYCDPSPSVVLTMVDGRIVAEAGKVVSVDELGLLSESREHFAAEQPRRRSEYAAAACLLPAYQAMIRRAAETEVDLTRTVVPR